jgi:YHS domain-containing protein
MNRCARLATAMAIAIASLALILARGFSPSARADDTATQSIPAPLAPLEYLLGRWNGRGVFKDSSSNRFRGWDEKHSWAWIFVKGEPVGLSVTIEGGKVLAEGKLTFDPVRNVYRLEGTEPKPGGPIVLEGTIEKSSKHLVLDRVDLAGNSAKDGPKIRLSLWTNANSLRYTMAEEVRERGAYQYSKLLEVGSTREGESLAPSGDSASSGVKCIVTGGAASMTLSYQGRTYPICCTGCRDAFNDDPEKYLKKASLMLGGQAGKTKNGQPAPSRVSRFDDAFANDVVESSSSDAPSAKVNEAAADANKSSVKSKGVTDASSSKAKKEAMPAGAKASNAAAAAKKAARASSLLRLGQSLEKEGNTKGAIGYFRQIVKEFAGTPAAKTAAERIKALE